MSFAAVVVSYNRIELLKKCLVALENQTRPLDEIIVVDNGSTDGSADYVAAEHPGVTLFRTGANLGGAGGFAWGVEIALAHGHEGAWLMDDDGEPELDAFAPIADVFETAEPRPSFVASLVTAGRGVYNERNPPVVSTDAEQQMRAAALGGVAIVSATFVGVMVNLEVAARTHLPLSDFFIWVDDSEYTRRLSHLGYAITLPTSMINHPNPPSITTDMGPRLFYYVRNRLWFVKERQAAFSANLLEVLDVLRHAFAQFPVAASKRRWFGSFGRGLWQAAVRKPRHQAPGSLLATLSPSQRAEILG